MKAYRLLYPLSLMASVLEVSRSGFYKWLSREASRREKEDNYLKTEIQRVHDWSRGTYGPVRIQAELKDAGIIVGRDRIGRLRRKMGLKCIQRKKFKATTNSKHNLPVAPNLLDQQFDIIEPGQVWGTDITYVGTDEGWLYLAGVKDFCSCEIVGYAMSSRMTKELVRSALRNALARRTPQADCIHHSDRGSQYCSHEYQKDLEKSGFRISMSRRGNCYDNAPTESLWGTIKQELIYQYKFKTRREARQAIQEYIEVFYNRMRRHSKIGYMAPSIYTEKNQQKRRTA